mgnify:CR=1 FL=1
MLAIQHAGGSLLLAAPTCSAAASGCAWRHARGATVHEDLHTGQSADGRLATPGWELPGFDASAWAVPAAVAGPPGEQVPHPMPRSRVLELVRPIAVAAVRGDNASGPGQTYRFTLPYEVAGFCTLVLPTACPAGAHTRLRHGEAIDGLSGPLVPVECTASFGADHRVCENTSYTCRGNGDYLGAHDARWRALALGTADAPVEAFTPAFQFSAFRFIEATYDGFGGPVPPPTLASLACYRIGTSFDWVGDVAVAGSPAAERFNTVVMATRSSAISNYLMDIPTDCPHREKRGWTGDSLAAHRALDSFFDMRAAWTKWVDDMILTQSRLAPAGTMPSIVPCIFDTGSCRGDPRTGGGPGRPTFADVAWGSMLPLLGAYTANLTGDVRLAARLGPAAAAYVRLLQSFANNGSSPYPMLLNYTGWPGSTLGDWVPAYSKNGSPRSVSSLLNSHHLILDADAAATVLAMAGQLAAAREMQTWAAAARVSFDAAFLGTAAVPSTATKTCGVVDEGAMAQLDCGDQTIARVVLASYGLATGTCPSGLQPSAQCHEDVAAQVAAACVGQRSCAIECRAVPHERLCAGANVSDPCPGVRKQLAVVVACSGPPPAPVTGLAYRDPHAPSVVHGQANSPPALQTEAAAGMAAMDAYTEHTPAQRAALGHMLAALVLNGSAVVTGGVIDMAHLAPALVAYGRPDAAFAFLSADGSPSLFRMARYGGTLWENWYDADGCDTAGGCNFKTAFSLNHIMYGGSVGEAVFGLGGLADARHIAPVVWLPGAMRGAAVRRAEAGVAAVTWAAAADAAGWQLWLNVTVPVGGARVDVMLPGNASRDAACVWDCTAVSDPPALYTERWVGFDAAGGHYRLSALAPLPNTAAPARAPPACRPLFPAGGAVWLDSAPGQRWLPAVSVSLASGSFALLATSQCQ